MDNFLVFLQPMIVGSSSIFASYIFYRKHFLSIQTYLQDAKLRRLVNMVKFSSSYSDGGLRINPSTEIDGIFVRLEDRAETVGFEITQGIALEVLRFFANRYNLNMTAIFRLPKEKNPRERSVDTSITISPSPVFSTNDENLIFSLQFADGLKIRTDHVAFYDLGRYLSEIGMIPRLLSVSQDGEEIYMSL